jgi:8-oxo-dGTP pyrophosphatase MutT (NUDIX family)
MEESIIIDLPGFKKEYDVEWFEETNFSNLQNIKQVYGAIFNEGGEVLIVNTVGNWQLPGGKPEKGEKLKETLLREVKEEASVEIEDIKPIGYQIVSEIKGEERGPEFCQIRFAARIKKLNNLEVDPATGKVPERKFIKTSEFLKYCPWGKIGQHIVDKARNLMNFS